MEQERGNQDPMAGMGEGYCELPLTAEEVRAELGALKLLGKEILKRIKRIEECIKD